MKRNLEQEATQVMHCICALIDHLTNADTRLYRRLEKEFQKARAQAELGLNTPATLAEPKWGWTLSATDLIVHIQKVWAANADVKATTEDQMRKLFSDET